MARFVDGMTSLLMQQKRINNLHPCMDCGAILKHTKRLILTSYPITYVYDCPRCGMTYYFLYDGVLCREKDFNERIGKYYDMS